MNTEERLWWMFWRRRELPKNYLGATFEHWFESEEEINAYEHSRTKYEWAVGVRSIVSYVFYLVYVVAVVITSRGEGTWRFAIVSLGLLVLGHFFATWIRTLLKRYQGVSVRLHCGWIAITSLRGKSKLFFEWDSVERIDHRNVTGVRWASGGCWISVRHHPRKGVMIGHGVLSKPGAVEAIKRWCDVHGVPLDGVAPLPDSNPYSAVRNSTE